MDRSRQPDSRQSLPRRHRPRWFPDSRSPKSGTERPNLADPPARFLVIRGFPYVVVYDTDTTPPTILRIVHGARDLPKALQDE
jgi:plasmid stabilization system protein ParE